LPPLCSCVHGGSAWLGSLLSYLTSLSGRQWTLSRFVQLGTVKGNPTENSKAQHTCFVVVWRKKVGRLKIV